LAVVELKPYLVTPELAAAALASETMTAVVTLADWIGDGRPVTDSGVLRPADAAEVCAVLGIELPSGKKPRSALDVHELTDYWEAALAAGLIEVSGRRVYRTGPRDLAEDPAAALDAWLGAVAQTVGVPDAPCGECLLALTLIAGADEDVAVEDLLVITGAAFHGPCPDCGEIHDEDHLIFGLAEFRLLGVLEPAGEPRGIMVRPTPLGRMLADSISALYEPAPEDAAEAMLARLVKVPPLPAMVFARPWLDARTPVEAARELFDLAATATPLTRSVAFDLAGLLGPESVPAWRERASVPGYGAYIRAWLDEHDEAAPVFPRDDAWLTADALSATLEEAEPEIAAVTLVSVIEDAGDDVAEVIKEVGGSGHPDARLLIDLLRSRRAALVPVAPPPVPDAVIVRSQPRGKKSKAGRKR
jgi:hypothetical protein